MRYFKSFFNIVFSRLFLVALMLAVQLSAIFIIVIYFSQELFYFYLAANILSVITVIGVVSNDENPAYKITWILAILAFPVIGWVFYFLFGHMRMPAKLRKRINSSLENTLRDMPPGNDCEARLSLADAHLGLQSRYIYNVAGFPPFDGTDAEYFPVGELMFERMLEELRKAERFIFLEYFIIRPGRMWAALFEILREKAAAGVEVRLMYDDLGSISSLPRKYRKIIRAAGIRVLVFNPFRPRISVLLNHRDHRKLCVIDGRIAFCGGINIADEYINEKDRFGHWKDTGVLLKGQAVWTFTFMFLQLWTFSTDEPIDFSRYRAEIPADPRAGIVQPFGESPLDKDNVTETIYLNVISRAMRYVYITTPYLVIGNEMEAALCAAAKSGVDVRIITPYNYDKWYVHVLTRSHYAKLTAAGVKIYEYTPGFMHGKMFVSDDKVCMVGTCNMDFRSFYLHFECGVLFYLTDLVHQVKEDMLNCQRRSHLVMWEETQHASPQIRLLRAILKLVAPLM